ncbi:Protein OS-9 [Podila clonocystis]|nr:Protein OS-9 [Podila clonocystis]
MTLAKRTSSPVLWVILAALLSRLSPSVYARSVGWVYRDLAFDHPTYNVQLLQEPLSLSAFVANIHHPTRQSARVQECAQHSGHDQARRITVVISWTYEFCYKGAVRQYYEADTDENKQPYKHAPVFVLGRFRPPRSLVSFEEHRDAKSSPSLRKDAATEFETKHDRNYLVQTWDHGDVCTLTNQPRQIRVHYQCALIPEDRIHSVTEPTICSYIIVINSPRLCIDPAFRVIRPPAPEPIQCQPIVLETKEAVGGVGSSSLAAPQKIAQLSEHTLKDHPVEEATRLARNSNDNGRNGRKGKHESGTGNALLGYLGSLRLISKDYPMETTGAPSSSKDPASERLQSDELDHRIPAQLSNIISEIDVEVLEQKDSQNSINDYSEHIKKSIKNGGRIPIHDLPPEELLDALEEAKESLEDEADAEEDSMDTDED